MKNFFTFAICFLLMTTAGFAQTFKLLNNDPAGDGTTGFPDFKSVSYDMDLAADTIWFKIEYYTPISPTSDYGVMIGIDTNMVTTDGHAWPGSSTSMKYDRAFMVFLNVVSPTYYGATGKPGPGVAYIPITVIRPDNYTFIIGVKLSRIDQDGKFNLLLGVGTWDIASNSTTTLRDEMSNTSYLTIPKATSIGHIATGRQAYIYPNPANDYIFLNMENISGAALLLYDYSGRTIKSVPVQHGSSIPVSDLREGLYIYDLKSGNESVKTGTITIVH